MNLQAKVTSRQALPDVRTAEFDMCQFGLCSPGGVSMKKRTKFMTNSKAVFAALNGRFCDNSHQHQTIEGSECGTKRSQHAQIYPDAFVHTVCRAILEEVA